MSHSIHDPASFDEPCWEDDVFWDDDDEPPPLALDLSPAQQVALAAAVEASLRRDGCDNTLRAARVWAAGEGIEWSGLRGRLESHGGYCDCEVLLNVLPGDEAEPD